jgi:hypothetical protein
MESLSDIRNGLRMGWSEIGEIIKAIAPVFTAGAACTAAWIGWRGLEKWRSETLGKRQADIAEATLASVYEMEEILRSARGPWVLPHETTKKEGIPDVIATDANFAPEARLLKHQDFFGRFRSQKYAFAAVFGREAAKPLDELWRCRMEINWAVDDLLRNKGMLRGDKDDRAFWNERRAIAFRPSKIEDDALGKSIAEQVFKIEEICRPAVEARAKP